MQTLPAKCEVKRTVLKPHQVHFDFPFEQLREFIMEYLFLIKPTADSFVRKQS